MIVVYPMLVSRAVGDNIIPGICKMIENYLIAYHMNDVLGDVRQRRRVNYKIRGKKIFREGDYNPVIVSEVGWNVPGPKVQDQEEERKEAEERRKEAEERRREKEAERKEKEFEYRKKQDRERATIEKERERKEEEERKKLKLSAKKPVDARVADIRTISLEPTYMQIRTQGGGVDFLGVKVVPVQVKSDAKLSHLMINDLSLGFIRSKLIGLGRKILRIFYRKFSSRDVPTGDPRKDILMSRTGLEGNAFVVFDKNEDIDSTLYSNPKLVSKLFGLSWGNIILADDINRKAYFCMKKFKGICSMVPYSMLYQTLGQRQTYDDLEDARQKSGAIFKRRKIRLKKVVGEQHAQLKLDSYQFLSEDSKNGKNR